MKDVEALRGCGRRRHRLAHAARHQSSRAAYFTRGTGHNEAAGYSERPEDWARIWSGCIASIDTARTLVPAPVIDAAPDAEIGIISYGTNDPAVRKRAIGWRRPASKPPTCASARCRWTTR